MIQDVTIPLIKSGQINKQGKHLFIWYKHIVRKNSSVNRSPLNKIGELLGQATAKKYQCQATIMHQISS